MFLSPMMLLAVVVALSGVSYLWLRARPAAAPVRRCMRCPGCGQKVRYLACRAGHAALCPRCRVRLTLPLDPCPLPAPMAGVGFRLRRR